MVEQSTAYIMDIEYKIIKPVDFVAIFVVSQLSIAVSVLETHQEPICWRKSEMTCKAKTDATLLLGDVSLSACSLKGLKTKALELFAQFAPVNPHHNRQKCVCNTL